MADFQIPDKTLLTAVDRAADSWLIYDNSATALKRTTVNYALDLTSHPVGVDDTQTLTAKTLTSPTINGATLSGTLAGTYTIGGTPTFPSSVVTLTGSQTLTNKVLTSPTINNATVANPTLTVDTVSEYTTANGVTVDSLNIKDGKLNTNDSVVTANVTDGAVTTAKIADDAVTAAKIDWATTGANGGIWWEELGRTTLSSSGDTIAVSGLPARKYLCVIVTAIATGGVITGNMTFNSDTAANYAIRVVADGVAATATAQSFIAVLGGSTTQFGSGEFYITNIAAQEKTLRGLSTRYTAGAATAPDAQRVTSAKWANTAAQISAITVSNTGAGSFDTGSEVIVLGHD